MIRPHGDMDRQRRAHCLPLGLPPCDISLPILPARRYRTHLLHTA